MDQYLVCSGRPWGKYVYEKYIKNFPGVWEFARNTRELKDRLTDYDSRYIFFVHWSEIVPAEIVNNYECVCFHPSALPHGRGGSPIQNQITDGYMITDITAFRMTEELDAGPIYCTESFILEGLAEEIYLKMAIEASNMIEWIIEDEPIPAMQTGFATTYKRRKPEQSEITRFNLSSSLAPNLRDMFDHIRMLDAEGYPRAYLEYEGFRFTFSRPALRTGKIVCDVEITEID